MTFSNSPRHDSSEEISREHRELRELLRRVDVVISEGASAASKLRSILGDLLDELKSHFANEETESHFGEIIERAPHFSEKIELLKRQHAEFLVAVRELIDLDGDAIASADGQTRFEATYREFIEKFLAHEAVENELLQEAYARDIGSSD